MMRHKPLLRPEDPHSGYPIEPDPWNTAKHQGLVVSWIAVYRSLVTTVTEAHELGSALSGLNRRGNSKFSRGWSLFLACYVTFRCGEREGGLSTENIAHDLPLIHDQENINNIQRYIKGYLKKNDIRKDSWAGKVRTGAAMMRNKTSSSLQKTYDECYLICSTAVYFEGQVCYYLGRLDETGSFHEG